MGRLDNLVKGALLHDIGKVVYRSGDMSGNHSSVGAQLIEEYIEDTAARKEITHCLRYHHGKPLSKATHLSNDDLAYIVYEADNLSAGLDRREFDEGEVEEQSGAKFDRYIPLQSIFSSFGGKQSNPRAHYRLRGINAEEGFNYPETTDSLRASDDKYKALMQTLRYNFATDIGKMDVNELLRIYEDTTSYVPSSTNTRELGDISLYMHSKIAAAIASCMKLYLEEIGENNYKECCFTSPEKFRKSDAFMLVSADISGIQEFIYTIPSKGALKSLRGRSTYLEIFLENIVDELLDDLELSRCNVIFIGGGHFYVLLPNTKKAHEILDDLENKVNHWLLETVGTQLYLAFGKAICSGQDMIDGKVQERLFRTVNQGTAAKKLNRYNEEELQALFNPHSGYNRVDQHSRECSICHTSVATLVPYANEQALVCEFCQALFNLGHDLVQYDSRVLMVTKPLDEGTLTEYAGVPMYSHHGEVMLYVVPEKDVDLVYHMTDVYRMYVKNQALTGSLVRNRLWMADYVSRDEYGRVYDFSELAHLSGGESVGINRLGVLRADVDDLSAAFMGGFINTSVDNPHKYTTLSRYADLSRDLSMFFKVAINQIVQGDVAGINDNADPYCLWSDGEPTRHIHVIYSGGDDVFLVGPWDELLEVAIDIRERLRDMTQDKMTMSAGLALFSSSYPISQMARITGELESLAKSQEGKDSIALFGMSTESDGERIVCHHVYHWDDLRDEVIENKLETLCSIFAVYETGKVESDSRLPLERSFIYKLKGLVEEIVKHPEERINSSRILYILARMEDRVKDAQKPMYTRLVESIHQWIQKPEGARELGTALELLIYLLRDKK